jgi:hypothetical protein
MKMEGLKNLKKIKTSKYTIIAFISILFLVITIANFNFLKYNEASNTLSSIDYLIETHQFNAAFKKLEDFNDTYTYTSLNEKADYRMKELQSISKTEFIKGINYINTTSSYDFAEIQLLFENFKKTYPFSNNINDVNKLIPLIKNYQYNKSKLEYTEIIIENLNKNGNIIDIIEDYINTTQKLCELSSEYLESNSKSSVNEILKSLEKDYYYYEDMEIKIETLKTSDNTNTFFSNEEYDLIKSLIHCSLSPTFSIYENITLLESPESLNESIKDDLDQYKILRPKVNLVLDNTKAFVNSIYKDKDMYLLKKEYLYNKIKNYNFQTL